MNDQAPPPQPAPATPPAPPADPPEARDPDKASGGIRALAGLAALVIGFAAAVVITVMVDLGSSPICDDVGGAAFPTEDCYDISSGIKPVSLVLGWAGGALGVLAALAFLRVAFTGFGRSIALKIAGAAIVLSAISILIA